MSPLAVGPILALLGVVAAFYVLRGKSKTRKSMYRTLREQRERDLRKARERATAAKAAAEQAAIAKEAAEQAEAQRAAAAAAAAAPPPAPSSTATIPAPATEEPKSEWTPTPAQEPAYTPPPPREPEPQPEPAYTPPPPPEPEPPAAQVEPTVVQPPAAEPADEVPAKPSWEIVEPSTGEHHAPEPLAPTIAAGAPKAGWELGTAQRKKIDEQYKGRGRPEEEDFGGDEADEGTESLAQTVLSYAGLVAALLVILLGIIFMIGSKATN